MNNYRNVFFCDFQLNTDFRSGRAKDYFLNDGLVKTQTFQFLYCSCDISRSVLKTVLKILKKTVEFNGCNFFRHAIWP